MRAFILLAMCLAVACGKQSTAVTGDPLGFEHAATNPQTACESTNSLDGLTLALRYQSAIVIDTQLYDDYTWLVKTARAVRPEFCSMLAQLDADPYSFLVNPNDDRATNAWMNGTVTTGIADIDNVLDSIAIVDIETLHANVEGAPYQFVFTTAQAISGKNLATALNATGKVQAFENAIGCLDGNVCGPTDITATRAGRSTTLVFSSGQASTTVTVTDDSVVSDQ